MSGSDAPTHPWIESEVSPTPAAPKDVEDGRERRKLKNEDSSYDSDFDPCETSTSPRHEDAHEDVSRTASETLAAEFEDYVTLTPSTAPCSKPPISKALYSHASVAATYTQSVPTTASSVYASSESSSKPIHAITTTTPQTITTSSSASTPSQVAPCSEESGTSPLVSLTTVIESAEYSQQVEFGVKLGYSESLVQLALTKLGLNPDKNELLDELIRLGAGAPRSDSDDDTPDDDEVEFTPPALRPIIIDGSNVAMSLGNKTKFCCKGIRVCVDWFKARGHKEIMVFVPRWRNETSRPDSIITDQEILQDLEKEGVLNWTPSRSCGGKRIISYDDRYIIKEALNCDGIIVSNDNYRDLIGESPAFKRVIETSLLMYSWVNGRFEPPDDPLGRNGPSLDVFLRKPLSCAGSSVNAKDSRPCPYGRKCTYGNKCKYMHPERGAAPVKSVTELLQEKKEKHYQHKAKSRDSSPGEGLRVKSLSLPTSSSEIAGGGGKRPLARTQSTFPAVSHTHTAASKDCTASESGSTPHPVLPLSHQMVHPPVSSQSSLDSLGGPHNKREANVFSSQRPHGQMSRGIPPPSWGESSPQGNQGGCHSIQDSPGENLHPKLQRQLSINPGGDDRLSKMTQHYRNVPPPSNEYQSHINPLSIQQQQQQQQLQLHQQFFQTSQHQLLENEALLNRSCMTPRCISPGPTFNHGYDMMKSYIHQPLTRHSSSQESNSVSSYPQHRLSPRFHSPVGRNLSAPDQIRGNGGQQQHPPVMPLIKRLNSTSDSKLNIHGNDSHSDCYVDSMNRLQYSHHPIVMSNSSPGPIGSRPMSPQQPLGPILQQTSSRLGPQHLTQTTSLNLPSHSSNTNEDERLKIFYHLSQLFPEAQVRGALARNPDETDPKKICMSILGVSNCRPVSPQQTTTSCVNFSTMGGGVNIQLRNTSFHPAFSTSGNSSGMDSARDAAAARESARIEAYTNLSKVFHEDQVRNVMLLYPEETCPTKLCRLIMALNNS